MKFSGKIGNGPVNNRLNFGGDPNHRLDTGIVFRNPDSHYWVIRKVVNGHSFILIRQMAVLVRRPLAEICTVLVLLHRESKKGATLTMAITLSILGDLQNSFTAAKSTKFPTKLILGCPPHLKYVAALPWKT